MGVKVHGVNALMTELEGRFNEKRMNSIVDEAVKKGSLIIAMELYRQFQTFRDQGYTIEDMVVGDPENISGNRTIRIYWKSGHMRNMVTVFNEWGTIRNPNPRGKGKIAKALKISQRPYSAAVRNELRRNI